MDGEPHEVKRPEYLKTCKNLQKLHKHVHDMDTCIYIYRGHPRLLTVMFWGEGNGIGCKRGKARSFVHLVWTLLDWFLKINLCKICE